MNRIKIINGALVVERDGSIIGCIENHKHGGGWHFLAVEGNPYSKQQANEFYGNGFLAQAMTQALEYKPYG